MSSLTRELLLPLFDKTRSSSERRAGGMTTIERVFDPHDGDAFVRKSYTDALSAMQKREASLLFEVAGTTVKLADRICPMKDRVVGLYEAKTCTVESSVQITLRWHGFDLDDWGKLLGAEKSPMLTDARFVLAILRAALKALQLIQAAGYVHGDVKADNFCLSFEQLTTGAHGTRGILRPDTLKLIDLGMTTSASQRQANQWPNLGNFRLKSKGTDDLLVRAYEAASNGDGTLFDEIDWRYDLWALGLMLQQWPGFEKSQICGQQRFTTRLSRLHRQLVDIYRTSDGAVLSEPPHAELIADINDAIGLDDTEWPFQVPDRVGTTSEAAPPTLVSEQRLPSAARWKVPMAVVSGLVLVATAWSFYNADAGRASPPAASSSVPTAPAITGTQALFDALERQAASSGLRVQARPERPGYSIGQALSFTVTSPINGHLAMLFADEGNAWPVVRTALTTKVQAGRTLYFPDGIEVLAAPPAGRMRWVAVVTPLPVDWAAQFATGGLQTQQITGAAASVSGEITITP